VLKSVLVRIIFCCPVNCRKEFSVVVLETASEICLCFCINFIIIADVVVVVDSKSLSSREIADAACGWALLKSISQNAEQMGSLEREIIAAGRCFCVRIMTSIIHHHVKSSKQQIKLSNDLRLFALFIEAVALDEAELPTSSITLKASFDRIRCLMK
jgi:hypothetical protein